MERMKVLVVGSGGREHALAWMIAGSPNVNEVICAPGNAGTELTLKCRNISIKANDISGLEKLAIDEGVDLVVVGPEEPLVLGIADVLEKHNIRVFGPSMLGAKLEGSKEFTKKILGKARIPTASYEVFTNPEKAKAYVSKHGLTKVIKADGLTGGKGVVVYKNIEEAHRAIDAMMVDGIYGEAGRKILIEDRLIGREASFMFFTDGKDILPLKLCEDHKQLLDGDQGPNTGGMGAYAPTKYIPGLEKQMKRMAKCLIDTLSEEGIRYKGVCYIGFMICGRELFVLEINCRLGDPETQPLMMIIKSDLVPILLACTDGTLGKQEIEWESRSAVCVVMASEGYPKNPIKGAVIHGIERFMNLEDVEIFISGAVLENDEFKTSGGRVLSITALGKDVSSAAKAVYEVVDGIYFKGRQFRRDISQRAY